MAIECLVLGAGQEVGKSCVVVTINGKKIMFDCGMHMGYDDKRRYPNFSLISKSRDFDNAITCIIITHFHLDHVGALPYFTEVCGYRGPIYMTYPTKALAPLMLEDYRKVMVDRRGEEETFTSDHIAECMRKVIAVDVKQTVQVDKDLQIRAYYAGHVLGAAMFYAKVGDASMVYTGDYNMTPDRHLGAAQIDRLQLDLLISESTYATTIRDSKYAREREFLKAVHKCVAGGGKVLIPTFALGRAQEKDKEGVLERFSPDYNTDGKSSVTFNLETEHWMPYKGNEAAVPMSRVRIGISFSKGEELCMLLDDYWERMNLQVPIYFSAGLTIQANMYYKMLISWTSQNVKETSSGRHAFDFKNVRDFDRSIINTPGPCVLFATPGMISGGFSLQVFKQWAPSEMNLVTLPGYCVAGTIGHKLMSGKPTKIDLDKDNQIDVRCKIHQLSFSPHTDSKGIMDLIKFLSPKHVMLVHGEKPKIASLKGKIMSELGIQCYDPANGQTVCIPSTHCVKASASDMFIRSCSNPNFKFSKNDLENRTDIQRLQVTDDRVGEGILVMEKCKKAKIVHKDELLFLLGEKEHVTQFMYCCPVDVYGWQKDESINFSSTGIVLDLQDKSFLIQQLLVRLSTELSGETIQDFGEHLQVESFRVSPCLKETCPYRIADKLQNESRTVFFCCTWSVADEKLAWRTISIMKNLDLCCTT